LEQYIALDPDCIVVAGTLTEASLFSAFQP